VVEHWLILLSLLLVVKDLLSLVSSFFWVMWVMPRMVIELFASCNVIFRKLGNSLASPIECYVVFMEKEESTYC
jgi:hypothetical protein